jgi:hypothetical protein
MNEHDSATAGLAHEGMRATDEVRRNATLEAV